VTAEQYRRGQDGVIGHAAQAPFLNQFGLSLTHPSQRNYLALFYGSTQGVTGSPPLEFSS
jgi:hypothetical protein